MTLTPERCAETAAQYRMSAQGCRDLAEEYDRNAERWELLAAATTPGEMDEARRAAGFIS